MRRKDKSALKQVGNVLFNILPQRAKSDLFLVFLRKNWSYFVGDLSKGSFPVYYKDGVLGVRCVSGVIAKEFMLRADLLKKSINESCSVYGVRVSRIVSTVGSFYKANKIKNKQSVRGFKKRSQSLRSIYVPVKLTRALDLFISDDSLRSCLRSLYRVYKAKFYTKKGE